MKLLFLTLLTSTFAVRRRKQQQPTKRWVVKPQQPAATAAREEARMAEVTERASQRNTEEAERIAEAEITNPVKLQTMEGDIFVVEQAHTGMTSLLQGFNLRGSEKSPNISQKTRFYFFQAYRDSVNEVGPPFRWGPFNFTAWCLYILTAPSNFIY